MISLILQHLESLQVELSKIDPASDNDAAEKVAELATHLRSTLSILRPTETRTDRPTRHRSVREAA